MVVARTYWLDLFTLETWQEFRDRGGTVSGFAEARRKTVERMKPGDYLLCYLTRVSRWVGILEVTGAAYHDESPIWTSSTYPSRIPVREVLALEPEFGVPVLSMRDELSVFENLNNPNKWSGPFRGSPARWKTADGDAVVRELQAAQLNPVEKPIRKGKKMAFRDSEVIEAADGTAAQTVPIEENDSTQAETEGTAHTEIQYLLMKMGADMGFDVHLARNDASRSWNGQRLGAMARRREQLPQQFDPTTNRTIELIDLLWLQGNAIVAAFEIESTTSIYSGLLRMSDLLAMQPNISVPLFLVAPEDRRRKVIEQVNRPTFARMTPPLVDICRYISFETLRESLDSARAFVRYLKSDWLQDISESCDPGSA
jgi:hypothetical protein